MSKAKRLFKFDNSYARLPAGFYQKINPSPVNNPSLIKINQELCEELGLEITKEQAAQILSGNQIAEGSEPLAQAYAGHQFGHFVPQLGDGRACLLGEVIDINGKRKDIQLKGSGQTQFSRAGDGRAALGPVIREYIISEAMQALGVPTTRSLAIVLTGEEIYREEALPGAVLTRVAASHIRVGSFEYFAARQDTESVKILADYVINRHYPEIQDSENPYTELLRAVCSKQAKLIAKWMQLGFIHGVMNTDNCSIAGETIDYGPCAFMNFYDPNTVFSSIDRHGRYAFEQQGPIGQWNLASFANTILSLIDPDQKKAISQAQEILEEYASTFQNQLDTGLMLKIGTKDTVLANELLQLMHKYRADFTLSFRYLSEMLIDQSHEPKFLALFDQNNEDLRDWVKRWRQAIPQDNKAVAQEMKTVNPAFIPRNHRVEEVIRAALTNQNYEPLHKFCSILSNPYQDQEQHSDYMLAPKDKNEQYQTFCGT